LAGWPIFVLPVRSLRSFREMSWDRASVEPHDPKAPVHESLGNRSTERIGKRFNVQRSPVDGRNCPLFLSDEQANGRTGKTIGLTELVFQEAKVGGGDVIRMADKESEDRWLDRHLGDKG